MASSLIKSSARILGGSAIAGIGFSFGRDLYRNAKKPDTRNMIIAGLLLLGSIIGAYVGGVWLARNYQSIWGSIFKRIGSVLVLMPSFAILLFVGSWVIGQTSSNQDSDAVGLEESTKVEKPTEIETQNPPATGDEQSSGFSVPVGAYYLPCGSLLVGLVVGGFQRKKRKLVWDAEQANERFMVERGLIEHEDGTLEDESTGQHYRIDSLGDRRITLFPIGKRGKRAYINIESNGRYSEFTGTVSTDS